MSEAVSGEPLTEGQQDEGAKTLKEVCEKLKKGPAGVLVFDLDFTVKPPEYELGLGGHNPGELPAESIELISEMLRAGWKVLLVTNQPRYGHQVARLWRQLRQGKYAIFPDSLVGVLGEKNVLGGGPDFLTRKYKGAGGAGEEAVVQRIAEILGESPDLANGGVHFVGDRDDTDGDFCRRVAEKMRGKTVVFHKVRGSEWIKRLPQKLRGLIP